MLSLSGQCNFISIYSVDVSVLWINIAKFVRLKAKCLFVLLNGIVLAEKQYVHARYHFLRSDDGSNCATLLIEIHLLKGYPSEVDMFLAQAVLQWVLLW